MPDLKKRNGGLGPGGTPRLQGAYAVALGILSSRLAGLVRERVFAHYLGNSDAAGAFRAALRIPNLLQNLFGEGVLSASFIPVYARLLEEGREEDAGRVAGATFSALLLAASACALLGTLASRPLIGVLAPGFTGDVREATIRMVQIMFPGTGLLVLSAWCLGILNSHRRFFVSYVAPVLWNASMITMLVAVGARYSSDRAGQMRLAHLVAWSMVAGSALQLLAQLPGALRLCRGLRLSVPRYEGPMALVFGNFLPAVMSRGVVQLSAYIDQILSSFLGAQMVSALAYAQTIYLLPISLFGMSISSAELPEMARTMGAPEEKAQALKRRLDAGLGRLSFLVIPSAVAFLFLGQSIAGVLLQTGHFREADSRLLWLILAGSSFGLLATTQARLCTSLFWALHDASTPAWYAFARVALAATIGCVIVFGFRDRLGPEYCAAGLTTASSVSGWLEFLLIRRALSSRLGAPLSGAIGAGQLWIAAVVGASIASLCGMLLPAGHPALRGIAILSIYGGGYLAVLLAWRNEHARDALTAARSRLTGA